MHPSLGGRPWLGECLFATFSAPEKVRDSYEERVGMSFLLSPFPRGGDSRDVKGHRSPRRGKGFASDTKTLTEGGPCPESITSPCQRLARGLGSGLKPLLKDKKGLGLLVTLQGGTLQKRGYGGFPPSESSLSKLLLNQVSDRNKHGRK